MSIEAIAQAFKVKGLSPPEKLTLIALANYANQDDQAWPSQHKIADITCLSLASIKRALKGLEEKGLIEREHRIRDNGSRTTDLISLRLGVTVSFGMVSERHPPPVRVTPPEPSLEPNKITTLLSKPSGFDEFWDLYPRKVGKGAARKAYATAIKKHPPDQILTDLKRLLPTLTAKPDFIPHASTWLNGERWDDERQDQTHTGFDLEAHNRRQKELLAMYERGEGLSA